MSGTAFRQAPPTAQDSAMAQQSGKTLLRLAQRGGSLALRVNGAGRGSLIELPAGAVVMLVDILNAMAEGRSVTLVPEDTELTTVQAAQILSVSRPFLIGLLETGAIPCRKVGKHRRIRLEDALAYKARVDRDREAVLDKLVDEAQTHEMGYGP